MQFKRFPYKTVCLHIYRRIICSTCLCGFLSVSLRMSVINSLLMSIRSNPWNSFLTEQFLSYFRAAYTTRLLGLCQKWVRVALAYAVTLWKTLKLFKWLLNHMFIEIHQGRSSKYRLHRGRVIKTEQQQHGFSKDFCNVLPTCHGLCQHPRHGCCWLAESGASCDHQGQQELTCDPEALKASLCPAR